MMPRDLKDLLRAFNDQGVKYLVVGGYAFARIRFRKTHREADQAVPFPLAP
jgi:hypothetical protein